MDKKEVKNPHWTTTSTEGGLLLKEENRDKIEEIRNSLKKDDSNNELIERLIRFHVKKRYENNLNHYKLDYVLYMLFDTIFECEFPIGTSIVGELYTTHETKDITKQEVERYINENFESYNDFRDWVINEMCGDIEEKDEYSYAWILTFVEHDLFDLLSEYIETHYDVATKRIFEFYDYFYEECSEEESIILLNRHFISKWVDMGDGGFSITYQIIEDAINKQFSSIEALHKWYNYNINEKSKEKVIFQDNSIESYSQLIQKESHYNQEVFPETIKMMEIIFGIEAVKIFCLLNAFKYRMRAGHKSEDVTKEIKKALDYEERYKQYTKQQLCQE